MICKECIQTHSRGTRFALFPELAISGSLNAQSHSSYFFSTYIQVARQQMKQSNLKEIEMLA